MQSGGGAKNPPWARSNVNTNMTGMNPQIMDPNAMMGQQGMMPFQQAQFNPNMMQASGGMPMQMGGQMPMNQMAQGQMYPGNVVAYPTPRALNPGMYQNSNTNQSSANSEQRVFTGTVTKTHNDFGFVDHDVFYQTSVCAKGVIPKVNDRVLVEASYNPNMPFKWNATRVQVLPKSGPGMNPKNQNQNQKSNYNAVPPPSGRDKQMQMRRDNRDDRPPRRNDDRDMIRKRSRSRSRSRSRDRRDSRNRRDSPPRKRAVMHQQSPVKYTVRVPRMPLDIQKVDVPTLSQRYTNLYVPSDFFNAQVKWGETFPPQTPFTLNNPCAYHVMYKEIENPVGNDAILEPPDADYRFSAKLRRKLPAGLARAVNKLSFHGFYPREDATKLQYGYVCLFLAGNGGKTICPRPVLDLLVNILCEHNFLKRSINFALVMLISLPTLESLYQKCGLTKVDEKEKRSNPKNPLHPTRLIKFLVGQKGKNGENFAIGGPWSPSLDGENPQTDPKVLVKTAIRTCKALTGLDLSSCTQWYRMVEFYYWREGSGGKSRLETVVLFLPDVWSAQPSRIDWTSVQEQYKAASEVALRKLEPEAATTKLPATTAKADTESAPAAAVAAEKSQIEKSDGNDSTITIDENDDDDVDKPEPTHYSKIDLRTIKVDPLRQELRARNVSCKGLRAQLVSRLSKLIKAEEENDGKSDDVMEVEDDENSKDEKPKEAEAKSEDIEIKEEPNEESTQSKDSDKQSQDGDVTEVKEEEKKEPEVKKKTEREIEEEKKKLEKDKQVLKSRYELPNAPHIIIHPSMSAKGGKFNCNVATLSLLLDYRVTDNKEHSFELFVFAELFNEMLMRDFGFYIYKTLYTLPEKPEEVKEKSEEKKEEKKDEKKDEKKEDKKDDKKDEKEKKIEDRRDSRRRERRDSHSDDERSTEPQRRRSRGVELPPDPYLLLSLVYFDTARGGSMSKKDLQNLFMSLGLQLSRSQIRSILEKVCVKDNFNYKSLMQTIKDLASGTPEAIQDLPLDSTVVSTSEVPPHIAELEQTIATGNRELLPVFNRGTVDGTATSDETKDVSDSGIVMYKSRVVDVGALVAAGARDTAVRARLEAALEQARGAARAARQAAASIQQAERGATTQLSDVSASLAAARARITSLTASSKIFHSALKSIQAKVEAVVNIKYEDDDVVEIVNGPSATHKKEETKVNEETKPDVKEPEPVKDEIVKSEDIKEENKDNKDNIATENMDLDDKE